MTTQGAMSLFHDLARVKAAGNEWLVLEVTSHALNQFRVWGIPFSVAVMTNVTHEHLDYHKTFERYRDAKLKLFKLVRQNKAGLGVGVANADDPSGEVFAQTARTAIRYGLKQGELKADKIKSTAAGSDFVARYGQKELHLHTNLPGDFNVYNSLAAAGLGLALKLDEKQIEAGVAAVQTVEGRMTSVDEGQDFTVIVDFAHTPNAIEQVVKAMRPLTKGRLIAVFGSAGGRDVTKRPRMGQVAGDLCDVVILTQDDDRHEDGQGIMEQIASGAEAAGKQREVDLYLIHDRTQAIQAAIQNAQAGDTILLLGKGHESTLIGPDGARPWSDVEEARKAIAALKLTS
jgi:UDP-N-acetylmuramoyl-L-alanyl-D-glutamate--2,6-diaminopimelate ligase